MNAPHGNDPSCPASTALVGFDPTRFAPPDRGRPATTSRPGVGGRLKRWGLVAAGVGLVGGLVVATRAVQQARQDAARTELVRDLPLRLVSRVDFQSRLTAAGRIESRQKTVITCQIERLTLSNEGRAIGSSGAAQILEIVDEGTIVKQGDLLCRLSSTEYEELVRTQQMKSEQAKAALEQAQLNFDVAELAVAEYRDGLHRQNIQDLEGQIALSESDLERANDRLRWTKEMLVKGYVPVAQRASAERSVAQLRHKLMGNKWDLNNFKSFGNSRTLMELQSEVEKRRFEVVANQQRVARTEERLAHYRKMVDFCTIRSPKDGVVIYATDPWRRNAPRLEAGVEVRQQQELFYLPDLKDMEVIAYLHETVAHQVTAGLAARVTVEGIGGKVLPGRVAEVAPLPVSSPVWTVDEDVKYFVATIRFQEVPAGLLPSMSAEVEIDLNRSRDVLAVPAEAIALEAGGDVCYVASSEGLERRRVTVGRSNRDLLEVTRGLAEGEEVVINPTRVAAIDSLLIHNPDRVGAGDPEPAPTEAGGFGPGPVGVD